MSVKTLCFDCHTPITIPAILSKVLRQDEDNTIYLNVVLNTRIDCDEYSPAYDCMELPALPEMIANGIVEDECGKCGINILVNCDVCEADEVPL